MKNTNNYSVGRWRDFGQYNVKSVRALRNTFEYLGLISDYTKKIDILLTVAFSRWSCGNFDMFRPL